MGLSDLGRISAISYSFLKLSAGNRTRLMDCSGMPIFLLILRMEATNVSRSSRWLKPLVILGAGHFGQRAVKVLGRDGQRPLRVVDKDMDSLSKLRGSNIELIHDDAVDYLVSNKGGLPEDTQIVPAVPFHFAWESAKRVLKERGHPVKPIPIPPEIKSSLPHVWEAADGSFLISYADFLCPDDCPEPPYCTVTGEKRDNPLYKLLDGLDVKGFKLYIVRSHQLAAGVGGYTLGDLMRLWSVLEDTAPAKWLLGTACKCHGVLSGLEVKERREATLISAR